MNQILLVEDDLNMGYLLREYLVQEGYHTRLCRDGESALQTFRENQFDLCILDIMIPKMDGFTLAKKIKSSDPSVPFLFLTARSLKMDKILGFKVGAEDYVTKPFDEEELLCRIKVMLNRKSAQKKDDPDTRCHTIGDYHFDHTVQKLSRKNTTWKLTRTESAVLRLLCLHRNKILHRELALEEIYGKQDYFLGRSFDVFISKLRKMLRHDPRIQIENIFGVGFIMHVPEE